MQSNRDLPQEKARYQPPTIQLVKLRTKETVLVACKGPVGQGEGLLYDCGVGHFCNQDTGAT